MPTDSWPTSKKAIASLQLDAKNPRLGRGSSSWSPRQIVQYLFTNDKALDVAKSVATRGYFPNEPLLAAREGDQLVVIEGNRRLAALKALHEPDLLEGPMRTQVEKLGRKLLNPDDLIRVPVTIAPSRKATDQQIAARHIGTPVLAWQSENRATFILEKLNEGYTAEALTTRLGFTPADVEAARRTRAIADMARSLTLPANVKVKLENPRAKILTTLERVFDSSVGRRYLMIEPDSAHGFRGKTTKSEFLKGFTKLVIDVAGEAESSRTLNKNEDIEKYFRALEPEERPTKKPGTFVPSDIAEDRPASTPGVSTASSRKRSKGVCRYVLPRDFKVNCDSDRLKEIRLELTRLDRERFRNAGAVLLRVFFELSAIDYLERTGGLADLIKRLGGKGTLQHELPTLKQMVVELKRIAHAKLKTSDAQMVEKAIKYDPSAPFSISELHSFVHNKNDFPHERDIFIFWKRTEPLFRLMLEEDPPK